MTSTDTLAQAVLAHLRKVGQWQTAFDVSRATSIKLGAVLVALDRLVQDGLAEENAWAERRNYQAVAK